jgi:hypothetical protein
MSAASARWRATLAPFAEIACYFLFFFICALVPSKSSMSLIDFFPVSLSELVETSDAILLTEYLDQTVEEIPIAKDYPPFKKMVSSFKVLEIIKNTTGEGIDHKIFVPQAEWKNELERHRTSFEENVSVSPTYKSYNSSTLSPRPIGILFLRKPVPADRSEFEYTVWDAFESPEKEEEILKMLGAGQLASSRPKEEE